MRTEERERKNLVVTNVATWSPQVQLTVLLEVERNKSPPSPPRLRQQLRRCLTPRFSSNRALSSSFHVPLMHNRSATYSCQPFLVFVFIIMLLFVRNRFATSSSSSRTLMTSTFVRAVCCVRQECMKNRRTLSRIRLRQTFMSPCVNTAFLSHLNQCMSGWEPCPYNTSSAVTDNFFPPSFPTPTAMPFPAGRSQRVTCYLFPSP